MKKKVLSIFAATIIAFVWSSLSFMVIPWHNVDLREFTQDGHAIGEALKVEALQPGIYLFPNLTHEVHGDPEKQKQWQESAQRGPFAYISVRPQGTGSNMGASMGTQFLTQLFAVTLASWLLARSTLKGAGQRGLFMSAVFLTGGILSHVPYWNWWAFPAITTWVNLIDLGIEGFLVGATLARVNRT